VQSWVRATETVKRTSHIVALALAALIVATPMAAFEAVRPYPILMRIEGYVGEKPPGITSLARWVIAGAGAQYTFHVTKLEPSVDIAYWNILNLLEPLPVTLTLYGSQPLLQRFAATPPGQPIALTGNFESGPGPVTLLLTAVDPLPTPTTAPALPPQAAPTNPPVQQTPA
jgi:hypothetical protein